MTDSARTNTPFTTSPKKYHNPYALSMKYPSSEPKGSEKTPYIFGIFGMFAAHTSRPPRVSATSHLPATIPLDDVTQ